MSRRRRPDETIHDYQHDMVGIPPTLDDLEALHTRYHEETSQP